MKVTLWWQNKLSQSETDEAILNGSTFGGSSSLGIDEKSGIDIGQNLTLADKKLVVSEDILWNSFLFFPTRDFNRRFDSFFVFQGGPGKEGNFLESLIALFKPPPPAKDRTELPNRSWTCVFWSRSAYKFTEAGGIVIALLSITSFLVQPFSRFLVIADFAFLCLWMILICRMFRCSDACSMCSLRFSFWFIEPLRVFVILSFDKINAVLNNKIHDF